MDSASPSDASCARETALFGSRSATFGNWMECNFAADWTPNGMRPLGSSLSHRGDHRPPAQGYGLA
jgi:hypothetical protein